MSTQELVSTAVLVAQGLSGLALRDPDLPARAAQFVVEDTNPQVLGELSRLEPGAGKLLGDPGRASWSFSGWQSDAEVLQAGLQSLAARHQLYGRAGGDPAYAAMLGRLGQVLAAADARQQLEEFDAALPDWLQYLLNDALNASLEGIHYTEHVASRSGWDINLLCAILRTQGLSPAPALLVCFEPPTRPRYQIDTIYQLLLEADTLDGFLAAHPEAVEESIGKLSPDGQVALASRIGANAALLTALDEHLVALAVADSDKVRHAASPLLASVEAQRRATLLAGHLRGGSRNARAAAAILLARLRAPGAAGLIEEALAMENHQPTEAALHGALLRLQGADAGGLTDMPALPPETAEAPTMLGADATILLEEIHADLLVHSRGKLDRWADEAVDPKSFYHGMLAEHEQLTVLGRTQFDAAVRVFNGVGSVADRSTLDSAEMRWVLRYGSGRMVALPGFGLRQLLRCVQLRENELLWCNEMFQQWLARQDVEALELRQMARVIVEEHGDAFAIADACLFYWYELAPQYLLVPHHVWPYFAAHPEAIDAGLGLAPSRLRHGHPYGMGATLDILGLFPHLPARWIPRLMDLALGEGKSYRARAQELLAKLPDIGHRVTEALVLGKQEPRIVAAHWLRQLGYRAAVPQLRAALAKEAKETVSAVLMTSLEALGEDLSAYLAADKLLAQATKILKAKAPAGLAWLNLDDLPACTWQDGSAVQADIVRAWVTLACKLKEPGGNALFERYLGLLATPSQAALGTFLLDAFIEHDTRILSLEEWEALRYRYGPREQHYVGSAIGEKGILALVHGMPGQQLATRVQRYLRDHPLRRAQIEALLEAASLSNDGAVIQLLLGVARRHRAASVQEKARVLVERIAERNGWTPDQLADRTVPTAGLEADGHMALQYGSRQFDVALDDALKVVLRNPDGKIVKALPEARQDDDPLAIKEAKALFSACKKEVKAVTEQQGVRLYEAMCAGRAWPAAEWREYLHAHPIVGRLAQRLVWIAGAADGTLEQAFRPTEDGTLIDQHHDMLALAPDANVRLAHASLLAPDVVDAWLQHVLDYRLIPLFAQLTRMPPALPAPGATLIDDRTGWLGDAFTLRAAFTKLGYQRGNAEEGGFFSHYFKTYASLGLGVRIEFSGNRLPEENVEAALMELQFYRLGARASMQAMPLEQVPPVLLAEGYGDYHAVADACGSFDADWRNKVGWG